MKIDGVGSAGEAGPIKKQNNPAKVDGNSFADMLSKAVSSGKSAGNAAGGSPLVPVSKVPFLGGVSGAGSDTSSAISRLDSLIGDLSLYQNSLANNNINLDRLRPMIDSLLAHKDELAEMLHSMPEGELKDLVSSAMSIVLDQSNQYDSAALL